MHAIPRSILGLATAAGCWAASVWLFAVKVPGDANALWLVAAILLGAASAIGVALGPVLASAEAAQARGWLAETACCLAWLALTAAALWWLGAPLPWLAAHPARPERLPASITLPTVLTLSITLIWMVRSVIGLIMGGIGVLWRRARHADSAGRAAPRR